MDIKVLLRPTIAVTVSAALCSGSLIGSLVLPHGDFSLDPSLVNYENGSKALHDAAVQLGQRVVDELKPDVILLTTPHGMALERDIAVYQNTDGKGYAVIGEDLHNASFPSYKVLSRSFAPCV